MQKNFCIWKWHKRVFGDGKKATIHSDAQRSREPEEVGRSKPLVVFGICCLFLWVGIVSYIVQITGL